MLSRAVSLQLEWKWTQEHWILLLEPVNEAPNPHRRLIYYSISTFNVGIDGMEKEKFVVVEFDLIMKGNPSMNVFLVVEFEAWLKFVSNGIEMALRRISFNSP